MHPLKRFLLFTLIICSCFSLAASVPGNYQLTNTSQGFKMKVKDLGVSVQGTFLPPDKGNWVAFWLVNDSYDEDLLFVNPQTKAVKRIAISRGFDGADTFSADFIRPVGFLTENDFIYTSARIVAHKPVYSIASVNISSGKETTLFDNVLKNIAFFRGPIWLNKSKDTLMAASDTGEIVHYNLKKRTSFVLKERFPAEWPSEPISVSSTGNYFEAWTIFDLNGNVVSKIENPNPNVKEPDEVDKQLEFGPDDKYVARSYTFDGSEEHILNPHTAYGDYSIAPQAIDIEKVSGKLVRRIQTTPKSNQYVEIHHWLSPDHIVLHYYKLKHYEDSDPDVIDSYYVNYDIASGKSVKISPPEEPEYDNGKTFTLRSGWKIDVEENLFQDKDNAVITFTKPDAPPTP
ncbi:hypothetical protein PCCS19_39080 [Paenibacillus sp. CCS19]|uniref:hypothetical protein n=1 Tax=Paenibacillus sp. CCS19 TaxID=3158387 RepID=UPI00255EBCCC|nr:hypothetical protein [Paenibacillus cellulosilyticus]GMK40852.1 hypothetical protein PCCS19_39080 [Paenibacillus cellulosilyticus]